MASSGGLEYTGELDANGKYSGYGTLRYTETDITYEGMFADGAYHGEGKLIYPGGVEYRTHWERGVELPAAGAVQFSDGLVFNPAQDLPQGVPVAGAPGAPRAIGTEWGYLSGSVPGGHDRRLWEEHLAGSRAAVQPRQSPAKVQHGATLGQAEAAAEAAATLRQREAEEAEARGGFGGRGGDRAGEGAGGSE